MRRIVSINKHIRSKGLLGVDSWSTNSERRIMSSNIRGNIDDGTYWCVGRSNPPFGVDRRRMSISRMLDMGGMPSASTDRTLIRTVNASKNSKLQAVAFDFQALLKNNDNVNSSTAAKQSIPQQAMSQTTTRTDSTTGQRKLQTKPEADWNKIQEVAALLKVELPSETRKGDADVSVRKTTLAKTAPHEDVRAKYARKIQGGLAGLELAKSQVHDSLARGDAAGHQVARKLAMEIPVVDSNLLGSKWISPPETSRLLSLLTYRSIRIALLPHPPMANNPQSQQEEEQSMRILAAQLKDVVVDVIVPGLDSSDGDALKDTIRRNVLNELQMDPHRVLMVSDRDDYLRAARDLGMQTCRLQPKNSRRGNISADFTATGIEDVQDVVNEINGISFNSVLNR